MSIVQLEDWTEQPPYFCRLQGHLDKPVLAWNFASSTLDCGGTHASGALVDSPSISPGAGGVSLVSSTVSASATGPRAAIQSDAMAALFGTQATTLIFQCRALTSSGASIGLGRPASSKCRFLVGTASGGTKVELANYNGSWATATWTGAQQAAYALDTFVLISAGGNSVRLVKNGKDWGWSSIASSSFPTATGETFTVGVTNGSSGSNNWYGSASEFTAVAAFAREFSLEEAVRYSQSPQSIWHLFAP